MGTLNWRTVPGIVLLSALVACGTTRSSDTQDTVAMTEGVHNQLSASERSAGWRLLFDGHSLEQWRGYQRQDVPSGWQAIDGELVRTGRGGDLITREQFANFELMLDWKVEPGGNSGIFFRATETEPSIYMSAPEMQVLDDAAHADGGSSLTSAGANYGLHPAPAGVVRPAGEWNSVRLVVNGRQVEHWLNGQKVVEYELHSPDWEARVRNSKFNDWPAYGRAMRGHIGLQDHGDRVYFRNIRIRELP
jgi:hypothetical protein